MGQIASALTLRSQGQLSSNTEANPKDKEQCKSITLRSGHELQNSEPEQSQPDHAKEKVSEEVQSFSEGLVSEDRPSDRITGRISGAPRVSPSTFSSEAKEEDG